MKKGIERRSKKTDEKERMACRSSDNVFPHDLAGFLEDDGDGDADDDHLGLTLISIPPLPFELDADVLTRRMAPRH